MSSDLGEEGQNIILYRLYFTVLLASGTMSSCVVSAKEPRERVNGMSCVCDVCASSSYYSECQCEPALIFVGVPLSEKLSAFPCLKRHRVSLLTPTGSTGIWQNVRSVYHYKDWLSRTSVLSQLLSWCFEPSQPQRVSQYWACLKWALIDDDDELMLNVLRCHLTY